MNGCIYRTKDGECDLWTDGKHKSFCDPDCIDKHPSNADRIRGMTDEELAHLLHTAEEHLFNGNLWDYKQWTEWLKSPVKDGDT